MTNSGNKWQELANKFDAKQFTTLHETLTFSEYLDKVFADPKIIRSAYQRAYDMIMSAGIKQFKKYRKTYNHYNFFDQGENPIFGLEDTINKFVQFIQGAAGNYGTEKRILLLHGPVGSAKSTICRAVKRGMEKYSTTSDGAWYTFKWKNLPTGKDGIYTHSEDECPMHEEPLKLIPVEIRQDILKQLNETSKLPYGLTCDGELDPRCKKFMEELMTRYEGNWQKVIEEHIVVVRKVFNEADRVGIATFQPKDEKNQDATELTGDINYAKLPHFGCDSDPRAFNFDGEFCAGNRGCVEFIEMLKLAQEFLYDLLGASQERSIKPKKFPQISVDTMLIGHTNNPEFEKLRANQSMEALRDRTVKIDVPYLTSWSQERAVLEHDYGNGRIRTHVAPHTLEIAALFAVLTRLQYDKDAKLSLVEKAKLYDGQALPGYNEDTVKELRDKYPNEGMQGGISARYVQDKIANCLASNYEYINPFMVMKELKEGLENSTLINNEDERGKYIDCADQAIKELDNILKAEVQKALVGDEKAVERLCDNYVANVMAYINKSKVMDPYTKREQEPNERLMRSIESKIGVVEQIADDFRRQIATFIASLAMDGKQFKWDSNPKLQKALEAKLFEDTKDHINLARTATSACVDKESQEKIEVVKKRLIERFGYNEQSAKDVLDYVSGVFSRGDVDETV